MKDKLFLRIDEAKQTRIIADVQSFVDSANMCKEFADNYGITFGIDQALKYAANPEMLLTDAVSHEVEKHGKENPYMQGYITKEVSSDFADVFGDNYKETFKGLNDPKNAKYVKLENGEFETKTEAIKNDCKIFIEGKALENYNDVVKVSEILKRLFANRTWIEQANPLSILFEPIYAGSDKEQPELFTPRKDLDYSKFG